MIAVTLGVALDVVLSLEVNRASADARWPGWFDVIRRYPWAAIPVLGVLLMACGLAPDLRDGNDETKSDADTAGQVAASTLNTVSPGILSAGTLLTST